MKKIRAYVSYPWAGINDDEYEFEVDDETTEDEIADIANEVINDLVWNRLCGGWEVVEDGQN